MLGGVSVSLRGELGIRSSGTVGWGTAAIILRASTWGSLTTSDTRLMGPQGTPSLGDQVHPCGHGLGAENLTEGGHALGAVGHPVVVRLEARVRHEVGSPDSLT